MHLLFYPCIGVEAPSKLHVLTSPQVQCSVTNPHFLSFPGGRKLSFDKLCDVPEIRHRSGHSIPSATL